MKLFALILTCEKYQDRQAAVRDTWAKDVDDYCFASSIEGDDKQKFYDKDDYASTKYKLFNALKWLTTVCDSWWVYIGDDDSFLNVPFAREYLKTADVNSLHGCVISMCGEHPLLKYPSGGAGFFCHSTIVRDLAAKIDIDKSMWFDVLVGLTYLPLIHVDTMHWNSVSAIGNVKNNMTYHFISPSLMRTLYKELHE